MQTRSLMHGSPCIKEIKKINKNLKGSHECDIENDELLMKREYLKNMYDEKKKHLFE